MQYFNQWLEGKTTLPDENKIKLAAKANGIKLGDTDMHQLKMGIEVEREHDGRRGKDTDVVPGDDFGTLIKIAMAHLREFPDYYTRLSKMEDLAKKGK